LDVHGLPLGTKVAPEKDASDLPLNSEIVLAPPKANAPKKKWTGSETKLLPRCNMKFWVSGAGMLVRMIAAPIAA
jgi:hypothetical protein